MPKTKSRVVSPRQPRQGALRKDMANLKRLLRTVVRSSKMRNQPRKP